MTEEIMNIRSLVEKAPDADILPDMIGCRSKIYGDGVGSRTGCHLLWCRA